MTELGVPRLRRRLMWGAVSRATVMTSLVPGRRSNPVLRRVGRVIVALALIAIGLVLGAVLFIYFFVEDVFAGLPATRAFLRDLFSRQAKLEKLATPQFARLAAVIES